MFTDTQGSKTAHYGQNERQRQTDRKENWWGGGGGEIKRLNRRERSEMLGHMVWWEIPH